MWFNHVIKIEDGAMINTKLLWTFITRGAMIMCSHNQDGIDIVLPVCSTKGNLSRDTVAAILIQVKNAKRIGCSIDKAIFDGMDPLSLGLFDKDSRKPVIRMVFALASSPPGVLFPAYTSIPVHALVELASLLPSIFGVQDCRRSRTLVTT